MRISLIALLKTKGIQADVQVREPDLDYATQKRVPEAPPVAIVFSIASPPLIQIGDIAFDGAPAGASDALDKEVGIRKGTFYSTQNFWSIQDLINNTLQDSGYLDSKSTLEPSQPTKDGNDYKVPITAHISAGQQYHVLSVKASGGPLLPNRDLSSYFTLKPGDNAKPDAFGRLAGALRSVYWQAGFPDAEFSGPPVVDREHALASYEFKVIPGPIYHLRSLKILHLDDAQEAQVKRLLVMKPGDIYNGMATSQLSQTLRQPNSPLAGYTFTYSPKEDKIEHVVDLTLDFFKQQR